MNRTFAALALLSACSELPAESIEVSAIKFEDDCPITGCGVNASFVGGIYFSDLNFLGKTNDEGVFMKGYTALPPGAVRLDVQKNKLVALGPFNNKVAEGFALVGSTMKLVIGTDSYPVTITEVHRKGPKYWTKDNDDVETYKLMYLPKDSSILEEVCVAEPAVGGTLQFDAAVFEGERYDSETKAISKTAEGEGWFTIGCLSGGAGKTFMMRHTIASSDLVKGVTTTPAERQAMVNAWTANYCGDGHSFTTTGTPLRMRDNKKWIVGNSWSWTTDIGQGISELASYEAIWNETGAVCLNVPRKFGPDAVANQKWMETIQQHCLDVRGATLPPCSTDGLLPAGWEASGHILTANPN